MALNLFGRDEPFAMTGKGAGSIPTARSVVRDLYELARKARHRVVEVPSYHEGHPLETVARQTYSYPWWVRVKVADEPGVFGRIASILGEHNLSITEAFQRGKQSLSALGEEVPEPDSLASIHLQLKRTQWGALEKALKAFEEEPAVSSTIALPIL